MTVVWRRLPSVLLVAGLAAALAACGSRLREERQEREESLNIYPATYRADLLAALHTYVSDPANIRDAYLTEPVIAPIGRQKRYTACVRFNARNGDGRYVGSRDVLAVFVSGRFDQFIETPAQGEAANQTDASTSAKELCSVAEYKRFPELEAMKR